MGSSPSKGTRGYSLKGKTMILHIIILGSIPNISNFVREAQFGWAKHWSRLGYKFNSYLEHFYRYAEIR